MDYAAEAARQRSRLVERGILTPGQALAAARSEISFRDSHCGLHFAGYAPCILPIGHQELEHQDANGHWFNIPLGNLGYFPEDSGRPQGTFTPKDGAYHQPLVIEAGIVNTDPAGAMVLVTTPCTCGDQDCGFTGVIYRSDWVHQPARTPA